jgi:eukaryotic translation initiation factor 2C
VITSDFASRGAVMVELGDKKKTARSRKFFFSQGKVPMSGGLEAWKGFYTSVRPIYKSLSININVATTAFYTAMNLLDAMDRARGMGVRPSRFTSYYFGLRISTSHLGYKARKTIRRVMEKGADEVTFFLGEGKDKKKVTVAEYFKTGQLIINSSFGEKNDGPLKLIIAF